MEQKSINFLKMISGVIAGMEQEKAVWEAETEIVSKHGSIKSLFDSIDGKNQSILSTDKTGYTSVKDNLFDNITEATHRLTRQMSAYAKINGNHVLLPLVDVSMSALTRGPEKEAVNRCAAIVEKAVQMLPQLATFKVKQEKLDEIRQQITDYNTSLDQRSTINTDLKISAEEINQGIASLRAMLDILDDLVEGIIEDEGFVARYKSWRKIPDYGKGKTLKNAEKPVSN